MNKRVIFMGTPHIAVPSLQALIDAGFDIPMVLSQPDKPSGRGKKISPTPVKELAMAHDIPVHQPATFKDNTEIYELLKAANADFFAVVAYGRILPKRVLELPKFAPINVHFSLLPLYRGAAPVNWAIYNGDEYTGVSTMFMAAGMDTGDILLVEKTPILKKSAVDIADELSITGAQLLVRTINDFTNIMPAPQNSDDATLAPMMSKDDGLIKWGQSAAQIERITRAFVPWPTAYTTLDGKTLKIFSADVGKTGKSGATGEVIDVSKQAITVQTGDGNLIITEIQLEGKRKMTVAEFLPGYNIKVGTRLGI